MKFTILFDPPYYIGLLEDERDGCLYAARHIFGAEPGDPQIYEFVLDDLYGLMRQMRVGLPVGFQPAERRVNSKRLQREIRRELERSGISSKAQEAMRLQIEANKEQRREQTRAEREAERQRRRALAAARARKRHKGR